MTEEEINIIISKYTGGEFIIVRFESNNGDEIRVIINFNDIESTEKFVNKLKESSEAKRGLIKRIGYSNENNSLSLAYYPFFPLYVFAIFCSN